MNYEELVCLKPTDLGYHPYLGNKIHHYMMNKIYYISYRHPEGHRYKLTGVLHQMCQLREHGSRLGHSMPGGNIVTGAKFLQPVWNMFPKEIHTELVNTR